MTNPEGLSPVNLTEQQAPTEIEPEFPKTPIFLVN